MLVILENDSHTFFSTILAHWLLNLASSHSIHVHSIVLVHVCAVQHKAGIQWVTIQVAFNLAVTLEVLVAFLSHIRYAFFPELCHFKFAVIGRLLSATSSVLVLYCLMVSFCSSVTDEPLRNLATECGLEFDEENTNVIDHVNFDHADNGRVSESVPFLVKKQTNKQCNPCCIFPPFLRSCIEYLCAPPEITQFDFISTSFVLFLALSVLAVSVIL